MNPLANKLPQGVMLITLLAVLAAGHAQAQMCKWTDENGTVHYDQTCPDNADAKEVQIDQSTPASSADDPYAASRAKAQSGSRVQEPSPFRKPKPSTAGKSASQLASACEKARQALIKPERASLIKQCQAQGDKDASYCKRFYADYGNGGRQGNHVVQPKYNNLPECVAAREAGAR